MGWLLRKRCVGATVTGQVSTSPESNQPFVLLRQVYEEVTEHALNGVPNEVCGLLTSSDGETVDGHWPIRTVAPSPTAFRMDPNDQRRALREIGEANVTWCATWHSHPKATVDPSASDLGQLKHWRRKTLVILSLSGATPVVASYINTKQGVVRRRVVVK